MTDKPSSRKVPTGEIGRAEHFHGRADVWRAFKEALKNAQLGSGGTVFLVQGPPGAGKSAILYEFGERVNAMPSWTHCHIDIDALHDSARLARMLGDDSYADRSTTSTKSTTTVGAQVVVSGQRSWQAGGSTEHSGPSVDALLIKHATKTGLLLTVDEVQGMQMCLAIPALKRALRSILSAIRNSELRVPVVLLVGGLGNSLDVLSEFGMSRLPIDNVVNLGRLDADAERRVIRDWIMKSGGVGDAHPHIVERWVGSIAAETDGWPQHIHNFAPQAAQWLQDHGGLMPENVPEEVLETGRARKREYYVQRVSGISRRFRQALARICAKTHNGASLDEYQLLSAFMKAVWEGDRQNASEIAKSTFQACVWKGVLSIDDEGDYRIPIPSMQDWLLTTYGGRPSGRGKRGTSSKER